MPELGDGRTQVTAGSARYGRATTGLATAAVAALSASALASVVWFGTEQLGGAAGVPGRFGDLGLAPAQVDLGHPATARPRVRPVRALPVVDLGLTQGAPASGAPVPLAPAESPTVPPTVVTPPTPQVTGPPQGGGLGSNGVGSGAQGSGGRPGPDMDPTLPPGHRWTLQLVLSDHADLGVFLADPLPGVGQLPAVDSPRSAAAVSAARNRLAWALTRAERRGVDVTAAGGHDSPTRQAPVARHATTAPTLTTTAKGRPTSETTTTTHGAAATGTAGPAAGASADHAQHGGPDSAHGAQGGGQGADQGYTGKHRRG
jgi:hypothetical protein